MAERHVIPGLREAVEHESTVRTAAFLGGEYVCGGVTFAELTLPRLALLMLTRSPLLFGGDVTPGDVLQFLWVTSPGFEPNGKDRDWFIRRNKKRNGQELYDACCEYTSVMLADMSLGGTSDGGIPPYSWMASVVDDLASEYGWPEDVILALPLRRVWQYRRAIARRRNPKAIFINRESDTVKQRYVDGLNQ